MVLKKAVSSNVIGRLTFGTFCIAWVFLIPFMTCCNRGVSWSANSVCLPQVTYMWRTADNYTLIVAKDKPLVARSKVASVVGSERLLILEQNSLNRR